MKTGIASTNIFNSFKAGREIAEKVLEKLDSTKPNLLLLYGSVQYDYNEVFDGILTVLEDDKIPMIGGTGFGIVGEEGCADFSLVLIGISDESLTPSIGYAERLNDDCYTAGLQAAKMALSNLKQTPVLGLLHSSFKGNATAVLNGVMSVLGEKIPICGGTTGDNVDFIKSYQFCNWNCVEDGVVLAILSGRIDYNIDVIQGWQPFGMEGYLQDFSGPLVKTVEHDITIKEFYYQRLGSQLLPQHFSMFPLAIYQPNGKDFILRAAMHVNEDGSIVLAGDVPPETSFIRISKADKSEVLLRVDEYMKNEFHYSIPPELILYFSCGGRKIVLGSDVDCEYNYVRNRLGPDVPIAGYFTFGEFAPFIEGKCYGPSLFHNQTLVLCSLWSK